MNPPEEPDRTCPGAGHGFPIHARFRPEATTRTRLHMPPRGSCFKTACAIGRERLDHRCQAVAGLTAATGSMPRQNWGAGATSAAVSVRRLGGERRIMRDSCRPKATGFRTVLLSTIVLWALPGCLVALADQPSSPTE